jgi:hypothetical protein
MGDKNAESFLQVLDQHFPESNKVALPPNRKQERMKKE